MADHPPAFVPPARTTSAPNPQQVGRQLPNLNLQPRGRGMGGPPFPPGPRPGPSPPPGAPQGGVPPQFQTHMHHHPQPGYPHQPHPHPHQGYPMHQPPPPMQQGYGQYGGPPAYYPPHQGGMPPPGPPHHYGYHKGMPPPGPSMHGGPPPFQPVARRPPMHPGAHGMMRGSPLPDDAGEPYPQDYPVVTRSPATSPAPGPFERSMNSATPPAEDAPRELEENHSGAAEEYEEEGEARNEEEDEYVDEDDTGESRGAPMQLHRQSEPAEPEEEEEEEEEAESETPREITVSGESVFSFAGMLRLRKHSESCPQAIKDFAVPLWGKNSLPAHMVSRDFFFQGEVKKRVERTLTKQVLGILSKLTPQNYDVLRGELLALPIRQSTQQEISDVVMTMYKKAVSPAEEHYVDLYTRLIVDLVTHTGQEKVGKDIRRAIIDHCQKQFEQPFQLNDEEYNDAAGTRLPEAEIEEKKTKLKEKLKANVKFLGHLFVNKLILEKVVNIVLFNMIYGTERSGSGKAKKYHPEDYQLEMFCELLKKVGPSLSDKVRQEYVSQYIATLNQFSREHPQNRIRFMIMNLLEVINNNWVDKRERAKGPMTLDDFDRHQYEEKMRQEEQVQAMIESKKRGERVKSASPVAQAAPPVMILRKEPVTPIVVPLPAVDKLMNTFSENGGIASPIVEAFKPLSTAQRAELVSKWFKRALTTARLTQERQQVRELFAALSEENTVKHSDLVQVVEGVVAGIVRDGDWDDQPKLFSSWAQIIGDGKSKILGMNLHSVFLRKLVSADPVPPPAVIAKFIGDVYGVAGSRLLSMPSNPREDSRRFRFLPILLDYLSEEGDIFEELLDVPEVCEDPEFKVYHMLQDRCTLRELQQYYESLSSKHEHAVIMKIICAVFTYCRCDPSKFLLERFADFVKGLFGNTEKQEREQRELAVLIEVFQTYKDLGRDPNHSLVTFVRYYTKERRVIVSSAIDTFKTWLTKNQEEAEARRLDDRSKN